MNHLIGQSKGLPCHSHFHPAKFPLMFTKRSHSTAAVALFLQLIEKQSKCVCLCLFFVSVQTSFNSIWFSVALFCELSRRGGIRTKSQFDQFNIMGISASWAGCVHEWEVSGHRWKLSFVNIRWSAISCIALLLGRYFAFRWKASMYRPTQKRNVSFRERNSLLLSRINLFSLVLIYSSRASVRLADFPSCCLLCAGNLHMHTTQNDTAAQIIKHILIGWPHQSERVPAAPE